jgi:hypothetical protein
MYTTVPSRPMPPVLIGDCHIDGAVDKATLQRVIGIPQAQIRADDAKAAVGCGRGGGKKSQKSERCESAGHDVFPLIGYQRVPAPVGLGAVMAHVAIFGKFKVNRWLRG